MTDLLPTCVNEIMIRSKIMMPLEVFESIRSLTVIDTDLSRNNDEN